MRWGGGKVRAWMSSQLLLLQPCFSGKDTEAPRQGDFPRVWKLLSCKRKTQTVVSEPFSLGFLPHTASSPDRARAWFTFGWDQCARNLQGSYNLGSTLVGKILFIWRPETWTLDLVKLSCLFHIGNESPEVRMRWERAGNWANTFHMEIWPCSFSLIYN